MFKYMIGPDADLRLFEIRHAEALYNLVERNRPHLHRWLTWLDQRRTLADFQAYIRRGLEKFAANDGFEAGIWYQDQLTGCICYHAIDWPNSKTSIGYWLGEEFQGKGLVTQACRAMVDYAIEELKLNRVELECAVENIKSQGIPERLGFTREGLVRQPEWLYDHFVDHYLYGMLAEDWRQLHETEDHAHWLATAHSV